MIPALTNHLWQSTAFAALAGLLTLALRKNRAQTRYWLWLAASIKFLVPFSLLVMIGGHFSWRTAPVVQPGMAFVIEEASQPFVAPLAASTLPVPAKAGFDPMRIIGMVWVFGFLAVLANWLVRWFRIRAVLCSSLPSKLDFPVPVRTSTSLMEPGVCGVFRPVLLLPDGITERLAPQQLRAILAHELSHIRRRDNLTAFIHMLVEAAFWFHPLLWWIGARLVEERERACDEAVLLNGGEPEVYAEGILNVCKLYVVSPLVCISGVTGANLKKRIEEIMSGHVALRLTTAKKAALAVFGVMALGVPVIVGVVNASIHAQTQVSAAIPKWEVASIKPCKPAPDAPGRRGGGVSVTPGRLHVTCMPVMFLIQSAYVSHANAILKPFDSVPISGGPAWLTSDRYDVEAKADGNPSAHVMEGPMLQALLEDRLKLKVRHETKEIPVYELTVAKSGFKLQPMKDGDCTPFDPLKPPDFSKTPAEIIAGCGAVRYGPPRGEKPAFVEYHGMSLDEISNMLVQVLERPVINKTGIAGIFHFHVDFVPDGTIPKFAPTIPDDPPGGASIFAAFQEQLGLKLERAKGPGDFIVIDSVERPSEN